MHLKRFLDLGRAMELKRIPCDMEYLVRETMALVKPGSLKLYSAWQNAGKSVEMHIYSKGGHGFGMDKQGLPADTWIERFYAWLQIQDLPG